MRLIDADELKKLFPDNGEGSWTYNITAKMYIDNAPTVENITVFCENADEKTIEDLKAELQSVIDARTKGEWITIKPFYELIDGHYQETHSKLDFVKCPFCETVYQGRHNFCGRCGADMRGKEE